MNGAGGGIFVDELSTISMVGPWAMDSNIAVSNSTVGGGAVFVADSGFTFTGEGTFSSNKAQASGRGGGVYAMGDIVIYGVKDITGNLAATGGGFACSELGDIEIVNVLGSINDNDGATLDTGSGGGVALTLGPAPLVNITMLGTAPDSTLAGNQCGTTLTSTLGGGVVRTQGDVYIATCVSEACISFKVMDNTSPDGGGVILAEGSVTALFGPKTQVISNHAQLNGGIIFAASVAEFSAGVVQMCTAGEAGGAIYSDGDVTITSVTEFSSNQAFDGDGGAIRALGQVVINSSGDFMSNEASGHGGAIYAEGGLIGGTLGSFIENDALDGSGGAIYVTSSSSVVITSVDGFH